MENHESRDSAVIIILLKKVLSLGNEIIPARVELADTIEDQLLLATLEELLLLHRLFLDNTIYRCIVATMLPAANRLIL